MIPAILSLHDLLDFISTILLLLRSHLQEMFLIQYSLVGLLEVIHLSRDSLEK